jgi:hypothetical protein
MSVDQAGAIASPFSPSVQYLIAALRSDRNAEADPVPMSDADWAMLPADAHRHGVSAMLPHVLCRHRHTPADVTAALNAQRLETAARGLEGVAQLIRIVRACAEHGVPLVVLKGPALGQWLYGDPVLRRFGDLDLLVTPGHRPRALDVLTALGYRLPSGMSPKTAATIYAGLGAWPLTGGGHRPVDLHWRLAHVRFPAPLRPSEIIADSIPLMCGGVEIRIPSPTHTALLIVQHSAKHIWCALEPLVSIAALMRRGDINWTRLRALARAAHGWHGAATGLRLASEVLGAPVPTDLLDEPWPPATTALRDQALAALCLPAGKFQDRWTERQAHRAAFDRRADRVRYDLLRVISPTPLEWQWCPLPDSLTALYAPMRLVRLGVEVMRGSPSPVTEMTIDGSRRDRVTYVESSTCSTHSPRDESHVQG